jgi:hypothetical protein
MQTSSSWATQQQLEAEEPMVEAEAKVGDQEDPEDGGEAKPTLGTPKVGFTTTRTKTNNEK